MNAIPSRVGDQPSAAPGDDPDEFPACPGCGYLRRTTGRCPECGLSYEAMTSLRDRALRRVGARWTGVWVLLALYLPQCWIFLMPGSWSAYRWSWIAYWPVLPGFLPGVVFGRAVFGVGPSDPSGIASMAAVTAALGIGAFMLARRGSTRRALVCTGLFGVGVVHAFVLHGLYSA